MKSKNVKQNGARKTGKNPYFFLFYIWYENMIQNTKSCDNYKTHKFT